MINGPLTPEELEEIRSQFTPTHPYYGLITRFLDHIEVLEKELQEMARNASSAWRAQEDALSEVASLQKALKQAIQVTEGLAEQQAMHDDWYKQPLEEARKALEKDIHEH